MQILRRCWVGVVVNVCILSYLLLFIPETCIMIPQLGQQRGYEHYWRDSFIGLLQKVGGNHDSQPSIRDCHFGISCWVPSFSATAALPGTFQNYVQFIIPKLVNPLKKLQFWFLLDNWLCFCIRYQIFVFLCNPGKGNNCRSLKDK